jgi:excisionase family DNA binding protein
MLEEYLSIKEFASLLRVSPTTIRRSIKSGKLQAFKIGKGKSVYRIPRSEVQRIALFDLKKVFEEKK